MRRILPAGLLAALFGGGWLLAAAPPFFPVAVWYGGGTARAPMLEPVGPESERAWRNDLAAMKALGFNTVRTWSSGAPPSPGKGSTGSTSSTSC